MNKKDGKIKQKWNLGKTKSKETHVIEAIEQKNIIGES